MRRKSRELALCALYQWELAGTEPGAGVEVVAEHFEAAKKSIPYGQQLALGVAEKRPEIDSLIEQNTSRWRIERMSVVDRNIMRIAVFEMLFMEDVPSTVAINEAIEVAKKFSTDDGPAFINGVLDAVRKNACRVEG